MKYILNEVKFVDGLDKRYVKVTFKDTNDNVRVVLFDRTTNEIYDYLIERTGVMYYNGLSSIELPTNLYYGKMSVYLLSQQDVKEFITAYNDEEYDNFNELYRYYNKHKSLLIASIQNELSENECIC